MSLLSVNPSTARTIERYPEMSPAEVDAALDAAREDWLVWKETSFEHRASLMREAAALLGARKDELARLMAEEMGKPVRQGRAEVEKCAWACAYYADHAAAHLAPDPVATGAGKSYVAFQPLGPVLAVMPWNFPLWQVYRFAAPALMAGNVGVLKHASNVSGCALAIEAMFRDAGFPEHAFRTLLLPSGRVKEIVEDRRIRAVTLTGSTPAGQAVASQAGAVLKKTVMELGGSDPYLILEDADLDQAARTCVDARLVNSGQSCIAAKRFIVVADVLEPFTERFVALMRARKVGDPLREDTEVGPLARADLRDDLHRQFTASVQAGARLLLGGEVPEG
ncbi:MAG TPA: aldehyde dehydrogenase family protein, partial [Candidatus Polarisedimenticolaceae bacterium]|nr:aldehyde dehydrogenase family protein [Candidatus Polarisedimenticolaceae bacterium]